MDLSFVTACGDAYEKVRENNKELFAHTYDSYDFYKVFLSFFKGGEGL